MGVGEGDGVKVGIDVDVVVGVAIPSCLTDKGGSGVTASTAVAICVAEVVEEIVSFVEEPWQPISINPKNSNRTMIRFVSN